MGRPPHLESRPGREHVREQTVGRFPELRQLGNDDIDPGSRVAPQKLSGPVRGSP